MVFVEQAHTQNERDRLFREAGGGALDLYRITDRCRSKAQNPHKKSDFEYPVNRDASACHDVPDDDFSGDGVEAVAQCPTPILFKRTMVDERTGTVYGTRIEKRSCNKKQCIVCGGHLRRQYVGHFSRIFAKLPRLIFFTLTIDPKVGVPYYLSRKYIVDGWSRFRKRVHRRGKFVYVATPESHKSGFVHLHVLCSAPAGITDEDLQTSWFDVGGGIVMDIQRFDKKKDPPEKLVGYVIKYVFKDAHQARGRRSLLCSQGTSFYAEEYREERRAWARQQRAERGEEVPGLLDMWEPVVVGKPKGSEDTPTAEEREMFRKMSKSLARSTMWVDAEKQIITYRGADGVIRKKHVEGAATRQQMSREIGRIRALQSEP